MPRSQHYQNFFFMRDDLIRTVADGLTSLAHRLEGRAAARLFDLHVVSEDFMMEFLNHLRPLRLKNLNAGRTDAFPAIDLGDEEQRLSFQITTDKSRRKILESLQTFNRHKLGEEYDRIQFVILRRKQKTYAPFNAGVKFSPSSDIIDVYDLIKEASECRTLVLQKLAKLMEEEGLVPLSQHANSLFQSVRDHVVIDNDAVVTQKQLVFRNGGPKTVRRVYIGSFLMSEDGKHHTVLYDEETNALMSGAEVRQGDILTKEGRSNFLNEDSEHYGTVLSQRIRDFVSQTHGKVRLFAVVRAVGDSADNTLVEFWASPHFDQIEAADWRHVHENSSGLLKKAIQISDARYLKRVDRKG